MQTEKKGTPYGDLLWAKDLSDRGELRQVDQVSYLFEAVVHLFKEIEDLKDLQDDQDELTSAIAGLEERMAGKEKERGARMKTSDMYRDLPDFYRTQIKSIKEARGYTAPELFARHCQLRGEQTFFEHALEGSAKAARFIKLSWPELVAELEKKTVGHDGLPYDDKPCDGPDCDGCADPLCGIEE